MFLSIDIKHTFSNYESTQQMDTYVMCACVFFLFEVFSSSSSSFIFWLLFFSASLVKQFGWQKKINVAFMCNDIYSFIPIHKWVCAHIDKRIRTRAHALPLAYHVHMDTTISRTTPRNAIDITEWAAWYTTINTTYDIAPCAAKSCT